MTTNTNHNANHDGPLTIGSGRKRLASFSRDGQVTVELAAALIKNGRAIRLGILRYGEEEATREISEETSFPLTVTEAREAISELEKLIEMAEENQRTDVLLGMGGGPR